MADIETALARLTAGLAEDERIARAAIGRGGREAGAVVQHWQWERVVGNDEIVLTDGSSPIDATYCYPDETDKVEGTAILLTAEHYPARVADWQLQDRLLPGVEEPHAGAAQHVARHDPARALRAVAAHRRILARHHPETVSGIVVHFGDSDRGVVQVCAGCGNRGNGFGYTAWPCPDVQDLMSIYAEPTEEKP